MINTQDKPMDDPEVEIFHFGRYLKTNSALPPDLVVFKAGIRFFIKEIFKKGKLPFRIDINCKRSGPQTSDKKLTATLIMKAYVKDGFFT